MARIRTIKPSFFRHEGLQDLETANPGRYIMLTFAGLWTLCDSKGRFEYKLRTINLDILPFIKFDIEESIQLLLDNGYIEKYSVSGKDYGFVPTFNEHQRITGKEATEGERFPAKLTGNIGETIGNQPVAQEKEKEGKEEMEEERNVITDRDPVLENSVLTFFGFNELAHFDKVKTVSAFCITLKKQNKYENFKKQFEAYKAYKAIVGFKHTFQNFIGEQSERFEKGKWNSENWTLKLQEEKEKSSAKKEIYSNGKQQKLRPTSSPIAQGGYGNL